MRSEIQTESVASILGALGEEIEVSPSTYKEAVNRYSAVNGWLADRDSPLNQYDLAIYPQGSFAIGTATRPVGDAEVDVDTVCLLRRPSPDLTQKGLKSLIGTRLLDPRSRYRDMIDPATGGRRCWTIRYADESRFHLDVLPAVPDAYAWLVRQGVDERFARHAIAITDSTSWAPTDPWPRSNPRGYSEWFREVHATQLLEARIAKAHVIRAEISQIPEDDVRTPLQRMVQLLKRHRDLQFGVDEDRPISVIITTLAARAYSGATDVASAISEGVPRMREMIETRDGQFWVSNPVNPAENFADKWNESPRKARLFQEWLTMVEVQHRSLLMASSFGRIEESISKAYGLRESAAALSKALTPRTEMLGASAVIVARKSSAPDPVRIERPESPSKPWARVLGK